MISKKTYSVIINFTLIGGLFLLGCSSDRKEMENIDVVRTVPGESISLETYKFGYSPKKIIAKKGDKITIYAITRDVPHGVFIDEYNIDVKVEPGNPQTIEFIADKAGIFKIECSVFCGKGHDFMKGELVVEE